MPGPDRSPYAPRGRAFLAESAKDVAEAGLSQALRASQQHHSSAPLPLSGAATNKSRGQCL
ncbi:MAG: hypothetical protein HOY69_04570 [Streptomyces sp.]|nr:hypothetical protein [Streptomyces sp.]